MKKAFYVFLGLAVITLCAMCATVAYFYSNLQCAAEHCGASAPPCVAYFYAIPFLIAVGVFVLAAVICLKKSREGR